MSNEIDSVSSDSLAELFQKNFDISVEVIEGIDLGAGYDKFESDELKDTSFFQYLPHILKTAQDAKFSKEAYRVTFEKGLGHLQRVKDVPFRFRANVVAPGMNNEITGQAVLEKMSAAPANIAYSIFNVAAAITGQYFLVRIDKKLASLERASRKILQFLSVDKSSKLQANGEFLSDSFQNIRYITKNDSYRLSTLNSCQDIRRNATADMKFFRAQLEDILNNIPQKGNYDRAIEGFKEFQAQISEYWYSIYLYGLSYLLEVILSETCDEEYIRFIGDKIIDSQFAYKEIVDKLFAAMTEYADNFCNSGIGFKETQHVLKLSNEAPGNSLFYSLLDLINSGLEKDESKRKQKRMAAKAKFEDSFSLYRDYEKLRAASKGLGMINAMYNNPLELIVKDDVIYIKKTEDDEADGV